MMISRFYSNATTIVLIIIVVYGSSGGGVGVNASATAPQAITIYTKNFSPFSLDGKGYSIDYARQLIKDVYGQAVTVTVSVLAGNTEIFDAVQVAPPNNTIYLGTAGITITAAREAVVDFLPPFFTSGFQVMVRAVSSLSQVMQKTVRNLCIAFALLLVLLVVVVYTMAPLAWFFEFGWSGDKVPIFIDWAVRKEEDKPVQWKGTVIVSGRFRRMFAEIFNAFMWTAYTLAGIETGYPNNKYARFIHSFLKFFKMLFFTIAIATFTAVATVSVQTTTIGQFSDLAGKPVCTVSGSTAEQFLADASVSVILVKRTNVDGMFDAFWAGECDAVVYDFPALKANIIKRQESGLDSSAVIVGNVFNKEYYGICVAPTLDSTFAAGTFEQLKKGVIALNGNYPFLAQLDDKWLKSNVASGSDAQVDIPTAAIVVPSLLGICFIIIGVAYLYRRYDEKSAHYERIRADAFDRDYRDDLKDVLRAEQNNEQIYMGTDMLMDQIVVPYITRLMRVVYEMELRSKGRDIHELEESQLPFSKRTFHGRVADTTEWKCPACTLLNLSDHDECVICRTKRPAGAMHESKNDDDGHVEVEMTDDFGGHVRQHSDQPGRRF